MLRIGLPFEADMLLKGVERGPNAVPLTQSIFDKQTLVPLGFRDHLVHDAELLEVRQPVKLELFYNTCAMSRD